nr:MAG TPA: hypothetical protein [Caudoviricetes sp.]
MIILLMLIQKLKLMLKLVRLLPRLGIFSVKL